MEKNQLTSTNLEKGTWDNSNDEYEKFELSVKHYFFNSVTPTDIKLVTVNVSGLFDAYLNNIPEEARQHYNCNACKHFINKYGRIVILSEDGKITSPIWNEEITPIFFRESVKVMKELVLKASINEAFITDKSVLGIPKTEEWTHLHVDIPTKLIHTEPLKTAHQKSTDIREERKLLIKALNKYSIEVVNEALRLLQSGTLNRSEICLGNIQWFKQVHDKINTIKDSKTKNNILWYLAMTAPTGFCHLTSNMSSTLLDSILEDEDFRTIKYKYEDRTKPTQYQRPQAAPSEGNKNRAEEIVKKLDCEKSLKRKFATVNEIEKIWEPKEVKKDEVKSEGIFSHVKTKEKESQKINKLDIPATVMTWDKFNKTVLPNALKIEYQVKVIDNFTAILTAVDMSAPPILQWDKQEQRNPFSWYLYSKGSNASQWNLSTGYNEVTAITYQPSMWFEGNYPKHSKGVIFILKDAKDSHYDKSGNGLFPSILRSELHEVRATIEAYSKEAVIENYDNASACGIMGQYGGNWNIKLRVTTGIGIAEYILDRWD